MKVICKDRLERFKAPIRAARGVSSVTSDVDRLFGPKTYEELEALEKQIRGKLDSNEPIDVDYWEHLLRSLLLWKAKARLKKMSQQIVQSGLQTLRKQQLEEAKLVEEKLGTILHGNLLARPAQVSRNDTSKLDPDPFLKLSIEDKGLEAVDEEAYLQRVTEERRKVLKLGYVPMAPRSADKTSGGLITRPAGGASLEISRFVTTGNDDSSHATSALYEREVARGVDENEEIFTGEESVTTASSSQWSNKHRPRKPRYFNRVQMGYEWNKYNQTHYDHDNPPPKVVQGYKFNIFYPDLIEKTKAPTYKIEREGGRKRGETSAPAGEEDTCLIRFVAGPPYEDIAFRIVDREWDYSAKRDRGFRSSFDKVFSTHSHDCLGQWLANCH
jgi:Cactus-binding C-terminus of cactin protein/Conserved mid region of cactin